jgi:hypothetical protein
MWSKTFESIKNSLLNHKKLEEVNYEMMKVRVAQTQLQTKKSSDSLDKKDYERKYMSQ